VSEQVNDQGKLFGQGIALGDSTHDQRAWHERLTTEQPPEVLVAAGILVAHACGAHSTAFATYCAWELYNAGALRMPPKLPEWSEVQARVQD
jgi:hypothetical protein